jgi:hypothetical protein
MREFLLIWKNELRKASSELDDEVGCDQIIPGFVPGFKRKAHPIYAKTQ